MYAKVMRIILHAFDAVGSLVRFLFEYAKDYRKAGAGGANSGDGNRE